MPDFDLYYRRTGSWPALTADAFEVSRDCPNAKLRFLEHGRYDCEPAGRGIWSVIRVNGDPSIAVGLLRGSHGLEGEFAKGRTGVLLADSISLLRAILRELEWNDQIDPSPWLQNLPETARVQRLVITRACA